MSQAVFDLQGYIIVLNKVLFVTRVFEAPEGEGFQFNVRFGDDSRLTPKYPTRHEADLERQLLVKALREA